MAAPLFGEVPGGKTEDAVPAAERLGEEVDLERRVQLLVDTTCLVLFNYVAQVSAPALAQRRLCRCCMHFLHVDLAW